MAFRATSPCPTCGRTGDVREDWSTGQCDDCYAEDHVYPEAEFDD